MQFIKNHYEKILLGAVLLGLVGLLVAMWFVIQADKQRMLDLKDVYFPTRVQPIPDLDLSRQDGVLTRLKSPQDLDFSTTNRLFNPVQWQRDLNGRLIKIVNGNEVGPGAAVVTKIDPLEFMISLDSVMTNDPSPRYKFLVMDETAELPAQRHPRPHYASKGETITDKLVGGKDEGFKLEDVKGPPDNPDALVLKLAETGETVTIAKDKPFRRVDGYTADLKYDPEKFSAAGLRVGNHVRFGGDDYNIIAIEQNEVILLAQSNQKKWTLPYAP